MRRRIYLDTVWGQYAGQYNPFPLNHFPFSRHILVDKGTLVLFQFFDFGLLEGNQVINFGAFPVEKVSNFLLFIQGWNTKWNLDKITVSQILAISNIVTGSLQSCNIH